MFYWVMQEVGGNLITHGYYKTEKGRDNRFEKVFGGEVSKFSNMSSDPEVAKQEFRDEQVRRL